MAKGIRKFLKGKNSYKGKQFEQRRPEGRAGNIAWGKKKRKGQGGAGRAKKISQLRGKGGWMNSRTA